MVKFKFNGLGLGDCLHLCFIAQVYLKHGVEFAVQVDEDKRWLFEACNVPLCDDAKQRHLWTGPAHIGRPFQGQDWQGNKIADQFVYSNPLPKLKLPINQLWYELLDIRFDLKDKIKNEFGWKDEPYVITHTRGTSNKRNKDIGHYELDLWKTLIKAGWKVVHLDWSKKTIFSRGGFFYDVCKDENVTVEQLVCLIYRAAGFIGLDSGPCMLTRLNYDLPTLQVWTRHCPAHYVLPRPALHALTDKANPTNHWNEAKKEPFQIEIVEGLNGAVITERMLSLLQRS